MLHHQLVNHMKELNYIVNEAGMCHGLACMGLQAVLLHDTQRLKRRLEVLAEIPENKLQTAIHSAEERRAQKHRIVKKLLQEKLQKKWNMVLSDNEKISFEKKLTAENQFTYYKELSDALSKADEELDEKDSILLSIPAFFDGIAVYFDPVNYSDLFEKDPNIILISKESFAEKKPNTNQIFVTLEEGKLKCKMLYEKEIKNILIDEEKWQKKLPPHFYKDLSIVLEKKPQEQIRLLGEDFREILYDSDPILKKNRRPKAQDTTAAFSRILPNKLLAENKKNQTFSAVSSCESWTGVYNNEELFSYFEILKNEFKKQDIKNPVVLILNNAFHAITVAWQSEPPGWHFIDANEMSKVDQLMDTAELTSCVKRSLTKNGITAAFSTSVFANQSIIKPLKETFKKVQSTEEWQLIHSIKDNKRKNDNGDWLYIASMIGETKKVKSLLESGVKSDEIIKLHGSNPLHMASQHGHIDSANLLLAYGADIKKQTQDERTALSLAAQLGHFNMVKLLLKNNPHLEEGEEESRAWYVDLPSIDKRTPLYSAAASGHADIVQLLLNHGANMNEMDQYGATPLYVASQNGHDEVVKIFLQENKIEDINLKSHMCASSLYIAAQLGHVKVMKELLQQKNIDVNTTCVASIPILIQQAERMNSTLSMKQLFINKGVLENNKGVLENKMLSNFSALHAAVYFNHKAAVELLLLNGADPNIKTEYNISPLELATAMGHHSICDILNRELLILKQEKLKIFLDELKEAVKEDKTSDILIKRKNDLLKECVAISKNCHSENNINKILELTLSICLQMRSSWDPRNTTKTGLKLCSLLKKSEYAVIADIIKPGRSSKIEYKDLTHFLEKKGLKWSNTQSNKNISHFLKTEPVKHFDEIEQQLQSLKKDQSGKEMKLI